MRWSSRRRRGFTIVEVMVFSVILLLLMGCIAMVVEGGLRYLRLGTAYQDAQSQTLVGMRHLVEDLGQASSVGRQPPSPLLNADHVIVLWPQPPPPATEWTYQGDDLQYYQWLCFYRNAATNELVRATLPVTGAPVISGDAPSAPTLSDFSTAKATPRVIGRGVTEFLVNDGVSGQQLSLRLTSAVATGTKKSTVITNRSVVTLPNP